ncbi:SNF2 family N-terminal domain [Seminavis robusta]|uniref:SNF2 family N-terminal domain n=1 Tax=Seminavis robusta TaxID=568900 RepID=A0A9N8DQ73_9STRA|nr:SNF2 family N-terminal domain [Seminavis robusta]|eukprot:Sro261_g101780.1 SNF2 family N-terminal domain (1097) ;mRNA; r:48434-51724
MAEERRTRSGVGRTDAMPVATHRDDPEGTIQNDVDVSQDLLLLAMLGVNSRAPPYAFDYLTPRDLMQLPVVSKTMQQYLQEIDYHGSKCGRLYKVPFPGFPGLFQGSKKLSDRAANRESYDGLFPHQLASLQAMHKAENANKDYGALRGGILADAPGLGKTITTLALIISTAGRRPTVPKEFWDSQKIQEGWEGLSQNPYCAGDVMVAIAPFRPLRKIYLAMAEHVQPPFPVARFPQLKDFETYVKRTVNNHATSAQKELFRQNLIQLQAGMIKSHRKTKSTEAGRRMAWERSLIPTSATLLVVPDALLEHWYQQIELHLNRFIFADTKEGRFDEQRQGEDGTGSKRAKSNNEEGRGVVFLDGVGDIADTQMPLGGVQRSNPLPLSWELSKYLIVVTTFSRCEQEFHKEVLGGRMESVSSVQGGKRKRSHLAVDGTSADYSLSTLLQMRWLRIVVDEGHELGTHEGGNGLTQFIHQIAAERRWVLSGTPTTGDEDDAQFTSKALDQLQRLLLFLRHPIYGTLLPAAPTSASPYVFDYKRVMKKAGNNQLEQKQRAKTTWVATVKEPFLQKKLGGREALLQVLHGVMVIHKKEDINLPKPDFVQSDVELPIPMQVQSNIRDNVASSATLLQEYLKTDEFQALVDGAQAGHILQKIQQAKDALQARGGPLENREGPLKMLSENEANPRGNTLAHKDRRPIKAVVYSSNKFNLRDVTEALYKKLTDENIAEAYDEQGYDCSSELSRFRHNRKVCRRCPVCSFLNEAVGTAKRREPKCENFLLEVVKPDDDSCRFLVEPERIIRALPPPIGNVPLERLNGAGYDEYGSNRRVWAVKDIVLVDIQDPHPLLVKRRDQGVWEEFGADRCMERAEEDRYLGSDWYFGPLPSLESNGGSRFMEVEISKWQHCGRYHNHSRWYTGPRLMEAPLEIIKENVFILSLDAGLSHGLDLSFVTHIFLLEPIDDAALLEQITSRAHRLGATGPVVVDTVNVHYKVEAETEAAVDTSLKIHQALDEEEEASKKLAKGASVQSNKQKGKSLSTVVCHFCYRQFGSISEAETHETTKCPRNPSVSLSSCPFTMSSVFRDIKPPPPRLSTIAQD